MIPYDVTIGDRVVVTGPPSSPHIGKAGTVRAVPFTRESATVELDHPRRYGATTRATEVHKVPPVGSNPFASSGRPRPSSTARPTPAAPSPMARELETLALKPERVQAAAMAHEMAGKDASLDRLIGIAEFVLGEHRPSPAPDAATPADRALVEGTGHFGGVSVYRDRSPDDDVVEINGEFVNADAMPDLIAYLQAALRVHREQKAHASQTSSARTPF